MPDANAGWYDDGTGTSRWWDGQRWTDQTQPAPPVGGIGGVVNRIQAEATSGSRPRPAVGLTKRVISLLTAQTL